MKRNRKPSNQAIKVLNTFLDSPTDWRYGYHLLKECGLQSGTLYPLLIRYVDLEILEAEWHPPSKKGRPARHAYRLSKKGLVFAHANVDSIADLSNQAGLTSS